jgi:hypothetical protein
MQRFDLSCGSKSDDGSIARKKRGNYGDKDDDSEENEDDNGNTGNDDWDVSNNLQFNESEIVDAVNFFGGNMGVAR